MGLPGSYLTNYLSVDRVSCQICRIVVASLKQNIFLYVKFILRELLQIYSIKFRFFNEYFCFCYLKNSSCTLNRRWWREGGRGENFFLTMACGVKGRGGQMIVKSCVSVKKSFFAPRFFSFMKEEVFLLEQWSHGWTSSTQRFTTDRTGAPFPRGIFRRHMCAPFRERHHMGAATQLSDFNYLWGWHNLLERSLFLAVNFR